MNQRSTPVFGLIGTVSWDEISDEAGDRFANLGGVLYQAAVLCGLGQETQLYARLADGLAPHFDVLIKDWTLLRREGLSRVPGPGNRVWLFYPSQKERVEVLESAVPALEPSPILRDLSRLDFLIMIVNSGYELELAGWRKIVEAASCPVWLDIHSLSLERVLGRPRAFRPIPEWRDWAQGVAFLQANRQEVACMMGRPERPVEAADIREFSRLAFALGLEAVFITLGREGALVMTSRQEKTISPRRAVRVKDTTGCGDVFGATAAVSLSRGSSPFEAGRAGVDLASLAAQVAGVRETYELALKIV
ncbi:MAG TPA: carbohydrate kinase family protein [Acidobacteriota bacterium]